MEKAIRYRLYPTNEQKIYFIRTFGCCRKVWNLMLLDKVQHYEETGHMLYNRPAQYKKQYLYLKEVDSLALANVQLQLQQSFHVFFSHKNIGFPKFKSAKHSKKSYTTNNQNGTISLVDGGIKLPKIGIIKAKLHRKPKNSWQLKSATVSMDSDGRFYVSVLFHYEENVNEISVINDDKVIGLDYKSDGLYVDSNGYCPRMKPYYRKTQKRLRKLQKKLSHRIESHIKKYGIKRKPVFNRKLEECKNIQKLKKKIAIVSCHSKNQRKDFLHKRSFEIANQFDVVCVEDLNMKALANKGFGNGKATLDNGYGMFLTFLQYKLDDRGKYLVKVDRFFPSSQICSDCGYINKEMKNLQIRKWKCPHCGEEYDRDVNAAINIRNEGLRLLREKLAL